MEFPIRKINEFNIIDMPEIVNYEANLSLKSKLEEMSRDGTIKLAIDLSKVSFIGSLGIGLLSFAKKLVETSGGSFGLLSPNDTVVKTIKRMNLYKLFTIYADDNAIP